MPHYNTGVRSQLYSLVKTYPRKRSSSIQGLALSRRTAFRKPPQLWGPPVLDPKPGQIKTCLALHGLARLYFNHICKGTGLTL